MLNGSLHEKTLRLELRTFEQDKWNALASDMSTRGYVQYRQVEVTICSATIRTYSLLFLLVVVDLVVPEQCLLNISERYRIVVPRETDNSG